MVAPMTAGTIARLKSAAAERLKDFIASQPHGDDLRFLARLESRHPRPSVRARRIAGGHAALRGSGHDMPERSTGTAESPRRGRTIGWRGTADPGSERSA